MFRNFEQQSSESRVVALLRLRRFRLASSGLPLRRRHRDDDRRHRNRHLPVEGVWGIDPQPI